MEVEFWSESHTAANPAEATKLLKDWSPGCRRRGWGSWASSPQKRRFRGDVFAVDNCLTRGYREDEARLFLELDSGLIKGNKHKSEHGKFCLYIRTFLCLFVCLFVLPWQWSNTDRPDLALLCPWAPQLVLVMFRFAPTGLMTEQSVTRTNPSECSAIWSQGKKKTE